MANPRGNPGNRGNKNPVKGRQARTKARRQAIGTLEDLKAKLWFAIGHAEAVLVQAAKDTDNELRLKAIHALSQCCGQYAKLIEASEFESRVRALEEKVAGKAA